jgi:predicted ArsR family transcriptional regulator
MQNELRTQILVLLNERTASRPEICKELGAEFDRVRYELQVLKKFKLIKQAYKRKVRGTYEVFYEATARAHLDRSEWPNVPPAVKGKMRGELLEIIMDDVVAAVTADMFDSLENAHMSWFPLIVDQQGWDDLTAALARTLVELGKIKGDSAERLIHANTEGISCTVSMVGYPSLNEDRKVGPPTDESKKSSGKSEPDTGGVA